MTVHASPAPSLEKLADDFSTTMSFHVAGASAILYHIIDRLVDEDMAFALASRRRVNELAEKGYRTLSGAVGANPPKANSYHLKAPWKVADCLNLAILGGGPNPFHGFEMGFRFES